MKMPRTTWQDDAYDALVERARCEKDQEDRFGMYRQADRILAEEAVFLPLWYGRTHLLVKPWVRVWPIPPFGLPFWKSVVIQPH